MVISCYDDTALWETVKDHEERILELETLCEKMNGDISSLQSLLEAIEEGDYIVGIDPLVENGVEVGYTLTFAHKGNINIYHGTDGVDGTDGKDGIDGEDGKDGTDGAAGADGQTPVIGVKIDGDGIYYWTLNGKWLLDENGNKVPVTGKDGADGSNGVPGADGSDGADGVTPHLKIEDSVWFISYDDGLTWVRLGVAGNAGSSESIFRNVEYDEDHIYFTLADGTVITASRGTAFDLTFIGGVEFAYSKGEEFELEYKITGATSQTVVTAFGPYGWRVKVVRTDDQSGHIKVTATQDAEDGDVAVIASDGKGNTLVRTLSFCEGVMRVNKNAFEVSHEASVLEIALSTNLEYEAVIDPDVDWMILTVESKSLEIRDEVVRIQISENTGNYMRSGYVSIMSSGGNEMERITVVQLPSDSEPEVPSGPVSATVAEFLAAAEDGTVYQLTGTITNVANTLWGNFYIKDNTGEAYIYGLCSPDGEKQYWEASGAAVGDVITIQTVRTSYNGIPQGEDAIFVSLEKGEPTPDPEPEDPVVPETVLTLTNAEICAAMTSSSTSYATYTIESASGNWTVNASQNNSNTFLQCRGRKGGYIKTPEFDKDIKSVTIHFTATKSVYANNTYCVFPSTWTAPTADDAYPEDGNVGKAVTDGSYSLTIPVDAGNKQVYISIIGTYSYYLDHIDVGF